MPGSTEPRGPTLMSEELKNITMAANDMAREIASLRAELKRARRYRTAWMVARARAIKVRNLSEIEFEFVSEAATNLIRAYCLPPQDALGDCPQCPSPDGTDKS